MTPVPNVVVKKDGFFTALVRGVFGLLMTVIVCCTGLGLYTIHVIDKKFTDIRSIGESVVSGLPQWRQSLPPVLADAINDRRAADYASNVDVKVSLVDSKRRDRQRAVIEVTNNGSETISVLSLNVRLEDGNEIPIRSFVTYAATPLALPDADWHGPILPGRTRKFATEVYVTDYDLKPIAEIADIRVAKPTSDLAADAKVAGAPTREQKAIEQKETLQLADRGDE